jgi:hypothetical protein
MPFPPPGALPAGIAAMVIAAAIWGYLEWQKQRIAALQAGCLAALDAEEWRRAELLGLRWAELEPSSSRVLVSLADAAKGQRAFDRMADYLGRVSDDDPQALKLLALAGELQFNEMQKPFAAERTWLRMIGIEPRASAPRKKLMYIYALTLQRQKLWMQIIEAIRTRSESPDAYVYLLLLNDLKFTDAFPRVTSWLEHNPDSEILQVAQAYALAEAPADIDLSRYGDGKLKPGDRSLVEKAMEKHPDNLELLAFQLAAAIEEGDIAQVARLLQNLPASADGDSRLWRARGWHARAVGDLANADNAYRRGVSIYPFDWRSRHEWSQVLRRLQRDNEAENQAELALTGKQLERDIMELTSTSQLPPIILARIGDYSNSLGQDEIAEAVAARTVAAEMPQRLQSCPPRAASFGICSTHRQPSTRLKSKGASVR